MALALFNPHKSIYGISPGLAEIAGRSFAGLNHPVRKEKPFLPAVDIVEHENHLVIHADLPGLTKDDVILEVEGDVLTLKGEMVSEHETGDRHFYRKERRRGSFERFFTLPENVNPEEIKASFKDGVLRVEVPKTEEKGPRKISVG